MKEGMLMKRKKCLILFVIVSTFSILCRYEHNVHAQIYQDGNYYWQSTALNFTSDDKACVTTCYSKGKYNTTKTNFNFTSTIVYNGLSGNNTYDISTDATHKKCTFNIRGFDPGYQWHSVTVYHQY